MSENGDAQKLLLNPHEAAEFLDVHEQTLARWRVEGSGPIFVRIGTKIRYHRHDLEKYLASRRVEPIDAILDEIPDELRAAVRKALPQIRREAPHAFDVFTAVTKYDPDAIESL